ncbi:MAG: type I-F CRISPR-associated protein Csy1 [Azoarcus sp.]|jgi:CRISPR-associated protein Csy1|nr:type I-F CRISPR-associated protein Csy1 [Azoarcus sp.]
MPDTKLSRREAFRAVIRSFLDERLEERCEKLVPDDPKRAQLIEQFQFATWLKDAARRVSWIQAATHSLKAIHPDARGSNLYCDPLSLMPRTEIGSHLLDEHFSCDVVGNAGALDVYKFLRLKVADQSLLDAILVQDVDLLAALSDDPLQAKTWASAFASLVSPRGAPTSHTRAKQVYWLIDGDANDNQAYHLLAPLFATSLTHQVYARIVRDRFGDEKHDLKAARQARREGKDHPCGYCTYPELLVQKLGGTKPQNISQLNSERHGENYLLGSLPPSPWMQYLPKAPYRTNSVFTRFGKLKSVRKMTENFRHFLETDPPDNRETRLKREVFMDALLDELLIFSHALQTRPAGWTQNPECELEENEKLWLDPKRAETDVDFNQKWQWMDWPGVVGERFGNWLNEQLGETLPFGDDEQREWQKALLRNMGWENRLHQMRTQLDAPHYIPTIPARKTP